MSVLKVDSKVFKETVLTSDKPVLLDFYADWCGPCQMMAPTIEQLAKEHPEYVIGKVNVDENMDLAVAFQVSSIPMLAVLKNGKVTKTVVGVREKDELLAMLKG